MIKSTQCRNCNAENSIGLMGSVEKSFIDHATELLKLKNMVHELTPETQRYTFKIFNELANETSYCLDGHKN